MGDLVSETSVGDLVAFSSSVYVGQAQMAAGGKTLKLISQNEVLRVSCSVDSGGRERIFSAQFNVSWPLSKKSELTHCGWLTPGISAPLRQEEVPDQLGVLYVVSSVPVRTQDKKVLLQNRDGGTVLHAQNCTCICYFSFVCLF